MTDPFLSSAERTMQQTDWAIPVMILVSVIYIISRLMFPRYHQRIAYAFFSWYEAYKLIEEKNVIFKRGGFLLKLVTLFCLSMLVFIQLTSFGTQTFPDKPFLAYLGVVIVVLAFFASRILFVFLFGFSFDKEDIALRFNQIYLLQFENLGTVILVPALILPFTPAFIKILLLIILWIIVGFWVIYTLLRELQLLKTKGISIFYMFLYLCTLEILPLWWVVQTITEGW